MSRAGKQGHYLFRVLCRLLLAVLTLAVLLCAGAWVLLNQVFNGPSPAARDALTLSLLDSEITSRIPGLFLEESVVDSIRDTAEAAVPGEVTDPALITVNPDPALWQDAPDGIRIEKYRSDSFTAHIMTVRDPGQVWLSYAADGSRITEQQEAENAAAAIYAAADTTQLLISGGVCASRVDADSGFAGFTADGILFLSGSMTPEEARTLQIRDGCGCGLILILNGNINEGVYNANSGFAPRVCIGQCSDGTVVLLTIDGLTTESMGGTYRDCIDILFEYGCVNACCLEDVPAAMLFGSRMIHSDALPRPENAVAAGFWMIRSGKEG